MTAFRLTKKNIITLAIMLVAAVVFALYAAEIGFSYRELIVGLSVAITAVVVFGGERGIRFGLVLWVLTLALGYRTVEWTKDLRIHPSELLLWLLLICVLAQRRLVNQSRLSLPWWLWLFIPFWALGWWPLIAGDTPWDRMLNEFRDFLLLIPLMIVVSVVLRNERYWRALLVAFFVASTWIAVMGVVEYSFPNITDLFPAFIHAAKPELTDEGFVRAQFSFWGGSQATFICVMALPLAFVLMTWWTRWYARIAIFIASALQILAIYIGGYRSLWAVLLVQVIIACILRLEKHGVAIALLCLVVGVAGYQFIPNTTERAMTGIAALRGQPIDHSAQDRKERALGALDQAIESPFGSGWSNAGWVHSDFLQVAVNLGIVPALIFLAGYLLTLQKLFGKTRQCLRTREQGDFALALLLGFVAVGEHLAVQGVEVLPQMVLPVWFIWSLVDVWLRQRSEAVETSYSYAPANLYPAANFQ
jgi:hypothetical protein